MVEALTHAGIAHGVNVEVLWVNSDYVTSANVDEILSEADGILVGGFGDRGIEGKVLAVKYARKIKFRFRNMPWHAYCRCGIARNVANLEGAHSSEIDPNTPIR